MDKIFLKACRGEPVDYTPIWLNRQAGRYMPEYHAVKGELSSLDFFKNPERAAQAALDAQRILDVDAAILFADLLPMLEPMGLSLDYKPASAGFRQPGAHRTRHRCPGQRAGRRGDALHSPDGSQYPCGTPRRRCADRIRRRSVHARILCH